MSMRLKQQKKGIKSVLVILTPVSDGAPPCSDVTEVIIRFMSAWTSAGCGGVFDAETVEHSFWLLEPSVVTLAILISESGSVLLSTPGESGVEEPPGCAGEEGEASFCSESSSSSMTIGSAAVVGGLGGAATVDELEDAGELGVFEGIAAVDMSTVVPVAAGSRQSVLGVSWESVVAEGWGASSPTRTTSSSVSSVPPSFVAPSSVSMETASPASSEGGVVCCWGEGVASMGSTCSPGSSATTGFGSDSPSIAQAATWQNRQRAVRRWGGENKCVFYDVWQVCRKHRYPQKASLLHIAFPWLVENCVIVNNNLFWVIITWLLAVIKRSVHQKVLTLALSLRNFWVSLTRVSCIDPWDTWWHTSLSVGEGNFVCEPHKSTKVARYHLPLDRWKMLPLFFNLIDLTLKNSHLILNQACPRYEPFISNCDLLPPRRVSSYDFTGCFHFVSSQNGCRGEAGVVMWLLCYFT